MLIQNLVPSYISGPVIVLYLLEIQDSQSNGKNKEENNSNSVW